jgi:hypothetical protein
MNWSKNYWSLLGLFFIGLFYVQTTQDIVEEKRFFDSNWTNLRDDAGIYYAYLPATFLKNDPFFTFLDHETGVVPEKGIQYWAFKSDHGGWVPKMTMGKAMLDLPFFLLADAYVKATKKYERNGFSLPYRFAIAAATLFYAFMGLIVMRSVLLHYFSDRTTALTLIIIALGTNLFHYSTHETGYTHPHNFFMLCTLIWLAIHWDRKNYGARSLLFGILCGLIVLVRPVNIILLIPLPFFYQYFKDNTFSEIGRASCRERV